jgi:hypothetical protein
MMVSRRFNSEEQSKLKRGVVAYICPLERGGKVDIMIICQASPPDWRPLNSERLRSDNTQLWTTVEVKQCDSMQP